MPTTVKGLVPSATYRMFYAAKVEPWVHRGELPPASPTYADIAVDATGTATIADAVMLPRIEFMLVNLANPRDTRRMLRSTTRGWPSS